MEGQQDEREDSTDIMPSDGNLEKVNNPHAFQSPITSLSLSPLSSCSCSCKTRRGKVTALQTAATAMASPSAGPSTVTPPDLEKYPYLAALNPAQLKGEKRSNTSQSRT